MPKLSDTMTEGVVAEWHKKVGDKVESGDLLATTEQMLVHVDMKKAKACEIEPAVKDILGKIWASHQKLPTPSQKGRVMAIKK